MVHASEKPPLAVRQSSDTPNRPSLTWRLGWYYFMTTCATDSPVAATSLKLPEELKRRIERLATAANKTPHAFMVDALAREAERAELRARFADEAARSEEEAVASGKAFELAATFDYLAERVSGTKARRPKARAWRRSK